MLTICTDTLPQSCLSYIAFRLSLLESLKLMDYARRLPAESCEPYGFLTEVPFLREVAPQVQVSLLADTWAKHLSPDRYHATLVDEGVVYAVCETAARVVEKLPEVVPAYLHGGPLDVQIPVDHFLASELRSLHLQLSNEGDFLLISQLQDLPPHEALEFKQQFHLPESYLRPLFDVLGQWHVPADVADKLEGLLNPVEKPRLLAGLRPVQPSSVSR